MSLGSRTCYRISTLARNQTATIPKEPLLFLYPRYCASSAIQAPPALSKLRTPRIDLPTPSKQDEFIAEAVPAVSHYAVSYESINNALSASSKYVRAKETSSRPLKSDPVSDEECKRENSRSTSTTKLENDARMPQPQSLEEALATLTKESLRAKLESSCVTSRRKRPSASRIRQEAMHIHRTLRDQLRKKDDWCSDWTIPLRELEENFPRQETGSGSKLLAMNTMSSRLLHDETDSQKYLKENYQRYLQTRAQDMPIPNIWSYSGFTKYVTELTQSKVTRHMNRFLYADRRDHYIMVERILGKIFFDDSLRPFLTIEAFNAAIGFFLRHDNPSRVRKLFTLMEKFSMDNDPETFNLMMGGAAAQKDLHNYTYLLRSMLRKGVKPNKATWLALLTVTTPNAAKLQIIDSMRERGILDDEAVLRDAACEVVPLAIVSHIQSGRDIASFFKENDHMYGPQWLSVRAGNKLCQRLLEHGLMTEAIEVLDIMVMRRCYPSNVTLNIFLGHCKRQRDLEGALCLIHWFHTICHSSSRTIACDTLTYDILFSLAWELCHFNCCRVIWCVACIDAAVSFRMQTLVLKSLLRNTPDKPRNQQQMWMKSAGKFIVGIDIYVGGESHRAHAGRTIINKLTDWAAMGDHRATAAKLASTVLEKDLEAVKHYSYAANFRELLTTALELDNTWRTDGTWRSGSTLWKRENAVRIDTQRRKDNPKWRWVS